ncbi:hypothetical protein G9A89_001632 [Geosiphon pyriformis]|nr:hypothetical protein G9A89_001632 [Geosiphon pyriformis]
MMVVMVKGILYKRGEVNLDQYLGKPIYLQQQFNIQSPRCTPFECVRGSAKFNCHFISIDWRYTLKPEDKTYTEFLDIDDRSPTRLPSVCSPEEKNRSHSSQPCTWNYWSRNNSYSGAGIWEVRIQPVVFSQISGGTKKYTKKLSASLLLLYPKMSSFTEYHKNTTAADLNLPQSPDCPIVQPEPPPVLGLKNSLVTSKASSLVVLQRQNEYKQYPERWFGLLIIILLNISVSLIWLTFAPVASLTQDYFEISLTAVNILTTEFLIVFVVLAPVLGWGLDRYGIRWMLIFAACINFLGAWTRYFAIFFHKNVAARYAILFIGQSFSGIGNAISWIVPTDYAMIWFDENSRTTANMIGTISNPLGNSLATILVPYIISEPRDIKMACLIFAIIATIITIPTFFLSAKPPTPPSYTSSIPRQSFISGVAQLSRNFNFWILFGAFSTVIGFLNAYSTLINQEVIPYGYTNKQAGFLGAAMVIPGMFGAGIAAPLSDKIHSFKLPVKILSSAVGVLFFIFTFVVKENNFAGIFIIAGLIGFFSYALMPLALEIGVECTYPVSPNLSATILWVGTAVLGIVYTLIMDWMRYPSDVGNPPANMKRSLWFEGIVALIFTLTIWFYKARDLRRAEDIRNATAISSLEPTNIVITEHDLVQRNSEKVLSDVESDSHRSQKVRLYNGQTILPQLSVAARYARQAYCLQENSADQVTPQIFAKAELARDITNSLNFYLYIKGPQLSDKEWENLNQESLKTHHVFPEAKIISLFYDQFLEAEEEIKNKVVNIYKEHKEKELISRFNIIGHGVGGVYAVLFALEWSNVVKPWVTEVYTFGEPRSGDFQFAKLIDRLQEKKINFYRVTHTDDHIPRIFGKDVLFHHQHEYWISQDCDCNGEPLVYKCMGSDLNESQECNNKFKNTISNSHNGPYFGNMMAICRI